MQESNTNRQGVRFVEVTEDYADQRIDNFLLRELKGVPKSYVYRILRRGEVRVNKGRIRANYRLQMGDQVRIPPLHLAEKEQKPLPGGRLLERLDQAILYEDKRILVLNKPSGVAVHGGSGLNHGVIEALRVLRPEEKQLELVHRLDRDTSGCLLIAKRRSALRTLHELLRRNQVDKRYIALVSGRWEKNKVRVDAPLRKNTLQGGERVVRVDPEGKEALTEFYVRERYRNATLVEARLMTGRTHQIRVHLAHLGTPILGDPKYGNADANRDLKALGLKRLFLHAESIGFRWPEGDELRIKAPLEPELEQLLSKLQSE